MRPEVCARPACWCRPVWRASAEGEPGRSRRGRDDCGGGVAVVAGGDLRAGCAARLAETLADVPRVHLHHEPFSDYEPVVRPLAAGMPDPSNRLGRLQLLGEVARGGMGIVLEVAIGTSAATWPSRSCSSRIARTPS